MAVRPVFVSDEKYYVLTYSTEFEYHNGLSKAQRQRSAQSLHRAFLAIDPEARLLEISSFSEKELGISLSAFNLMLSLNDGRKIPVECAYQGGKVFEHGGPYKDLLDAAPRDAKGDDRLSESGKIIGFEFEGRTFPTEPTSLFYTWLYMKALYESRDLAEELVQYNAFTDIVFNPKRSLNCQAYVCALFVSLNKRNEVERALDDIAFFSEVLRKAAPRYGEAVRSVVEIQRVKGEGTGNGFRGSSMPEEGKRDGIDVQPTKKASSDATVPVVSSTFHVQDVIQHPKYGKGLITRIEESGKNIRLYVKFERSADEKQLNENWVKEHCQRIIFQGNTD